MNSDNLDDLDCLSNEEIFKLVKKDRELAIQRFRKKYSNYDIVFQTPYGVFGQNRENPNGFVVLGIQPSSSIAQHILSEGRIYVAGFTNGFLGQNVHKDSDLRRDNLDYFFTYGKIDGESFREFLIRVKSNGQMK